MKRWIALALAAVLLVILTATGRAADKKIVFGLGISAPYAPFVVAIVGMGPSFTTVVAAEMIAAETGLGYLIINSRLWFHTDVIFVGIIMLGTLGYLADKTFQGLVHRLGWRYAPTN
jgi:hypothetical protein